jgi:hypothetical protein
LIQDEYRPLIRALVQEINELLGRVRLFAEQNHSQLRRSLELMDHFLVTFSTNGDGAQLATQKSQMEAGSAPRPISTAVV